MEFVFFMMSELPKDVPRSVSEIVFVIMYPSEQDCERGRIITRNRTVQQQTTAL
jgi:hypothetical protein